MTKSLFSSQWYRVALLHPRLRPQVRAQRRLRRGQRWYILSDAATGQQLVVNSAAYQFVGRCDGHHDVQRIWDALLETLGEDAPTQDEVIQLLEQLNEHELIQCERTPDNEALFQRCEERNRRKRRLLLNPLAFRLPLGDPSGWLPRLDGVGRFLFRPAVFWIWLGLLAVAVLVAAANWDELHAHGEKFLFSPVYFGLTWLLYPLLKGLHELAHAVAVRRWGGEVHEMGISLVVLLPAPYVDASASARFGPRTERAAVAAAGIAVETALAALALFLWLSIQPGIVRDMAFVVMSIGALSTLVFNGNPLLRFDGYYILCDLLDLPNLAPRSVAYWGSALRRVLLRESDEPSRPSGGERWWLVCYGPASFAYRLGISLGLIVWIGAKSLLLGLLFAAYLVVAMLLRPVVSWARQTLAAAAPGPKLLRVRTGIALLVGVPGLLLFALPMPLRTVAPAVVWLPERALVRPETEGFIAELPVPDATRVRPGDVLAVLENPELLASREQQVSRLGGLEANEYQLMLRDPLGAQNLSEQIAQARAELERTDQSIAQLAVRANVEGALAMPGQADLRGAFRRRGESLGYVLDRSELRVRAVVADEDAQLVRTRTRRIDVRLAEHPGLVLSAQMAQDQPAASTVLPSPALGDRGGGTIPTDPGDKEGRQTLAPVFLIDVAVRDTQLERVGGRAWVRFDHGFEPLAMQFFRRGSQLILKHFDPAP
jgi:putative peptide zinc metalloprotease protein